MPFILMTWDSPDGNRRFNYETQEFESFEDASAQAEELHLYGEGTQSIIFSSWEEFDRYHAAIETEEWERYHAALEEDCPPLS